MNTIYNFFISYGYVFELLIALLLFTFSLKQRKLFLLRFCLSVALFFGLAYLWNTIFPYTMLFQILVWTLYFLIAFSGILFCFKVNFGVALFCSIGAYATQHLAFKTGSVLSILVSGADPDNFFTGVFISSFIYITVVGIVLIISYFAFARRIRKNEAVYIIKNTQVLLLSLALIVFAIITQVVFDQYGEDMDMPMFLTFAVYGILCSVFTLSIQSGMFESGRMRQDIKVMEYILHQQKTQMESSKKNIELINIKCHDIKHQISLLGDRLTSDEKNELERIVSVYDSSLKTGNEALDIVLTEKSLFCERNKIKLDCIADGKRLSFMRSSDIYSLFGNAIDNSIEAVQKIEDTDKRLISVRVKESMMMLSVHIINNYIGSLVYTEGFPVTTKSGGEYHGFGLKSIKMLVEKYSGNMTIRAENDMFNLNILFPLV